MHICMFWYAAISRTQRLFRNIVKIPAPGQSPATQKLTCTACPRDLEEVNGFLLLRSPFKIVSSPSPAATCSAIEASLWLKAPKSRRILSNSRSVGTRECIEWTQDVAESRTAEASSNRPLVIPPGCPRWLSRCKRVVIRNFQMQLHSAGAVQSSACNCIYSRALYAYKCTLSRLKTCMR